MEMIAETLYVSAERARETLSLLVPRLAKKRKWSREDCDAVAVVYGLWNPSVDQLVHEGVQYKWVAAYFVRVHGVFDAVREWEGDRATRKFLTAPNARLRFRRPLDLLRQSEYESGDSGNKVLDAYVWQERMDTVRFRAGFQGIFVPRMSGHSACFLIVKASEQCPFNLLNFPRQSVNNFVLRRSTYALSHRAAAAKLLNPLMVLSRPLRCEL